MGYRLDVTEETIGKIRQALQNVINLTSSVDGHERKRFARQIERTTEDIYRALNLYDKDNKPKLNVPMPVLKQKPQRKLEEIPKEIADALGKTAIDGGPTSMEMEG